MSAAVDVSVVMGVYNGERNLTRTLDNILSQGDIDLELVAVDDGSSDSTWQILQRRAEIEPRLKLCRVEHSGLTNALIAGCALAQGEFIARQDVGDLSLPGRLLKQKKVLDELPNVAFVACQAELVGPKGELLAESLPLDGGTEIVNSLKGRPARNMLTPFHGSVMFRRDGYQKVGGYRSQFYFAQDLDLWSRLIEVGDLAFVGEVLYRSTFAPTGISARYRSAQVQLKVLIEEATNRRYNNLPEEDALDLSAQVRPAVRPVVPADISEADYFIASCLHARCDPRARQYLKAAIRSNPLHMRAWAKLLSSILPRRLNQAVGQSSFKAANGE